MAKWCVYTPQVDVEIPFKVLEEIADWLERVAGSGFRVGELVKQNCNGSLVGGIEEEMLSESV